MKRSLIVSSILFALLGLAPSVARSQLIQIDGSSTVFPITEAVAEEFQKSKKGKIKVTVGIAGTGGGFKKFCRGETDISNASRPILKQEIEACKGSGVQFIELPVAYDALTVIVHPKNDWVKAFTVADLKRMWEPSAQGRVTRWNQVRTEWPNNPLKLFGPGADSGTFDYFTEAVVGKAKSSRGDFTASEDDNVLVQGVASDRNALGYFGFAYFIENQSRLKAVPIDGGKGPVMPSASTVEGGTYQPLSRPIFIYLSKKSYDSRPEVREFVQYYLQQGPALIKQVKYVPLPQNAYAIGIDHLKKGKVGSVFGGTAEVGVKIEELLSREAQF